MADGKHDEHEATTSTKTEVACGPPACGRPDKSNHTGEYK